jgi:hypothetical protein
MDPKSGTVYLALPMPVARCARVELVAGQAATVTVSGARGPRPPRGSGLLHVEHHTSAAPLGADNRVLDAGGSGRVAAIVMDDVDGGPVSAVTPLQRFLEGDERVCVDGSRSPVQYGTGHEEQFDGGYYYELGAYSGLFGGAGPLGNTGAGDGTQSQYRVFADDGMRWSNAIAYGEEHGGGDEQPDTVELTTFSYRGPATLRQTGSADLAGDRSLTAYFEGEHDGNSTTSTVIAGGSYYPAPDPADSPEGVTARGTTLTGPRDFTLRIDKRNVGVVLRGLFDVAPPLSALRVSVDGHPAGLWASPTAIANPAKRWLEDDFDLPPKLTAGKSRVRVTLTPAWQPKTDLYELKALSRLSAVKAPSQPR